VAAFSEQTLLNLTTPGRDVVHLPVVEGETLVAYAQLDDGSAELAVHPDHRRRGLGGRLLDAVLAAAPQTRVWAHGPPPGARAPAQPEVADGVALTTIVPDSEAGAWVAGNARAFADHPEQGHMTRADLDARHAEPWFDPEGFWLACDAGTGALLASMWTKVSD